MKFSSPRPVRILPSRKQILFFAMFALLFHETGFAQTRHKAQKQGFSMRMMINNVGAMGRVAYPPFRFSPSPPADSLGLEYPMGEPIEHLFGGGLWIAGKLDTSAPGRSSPPLRLVTVSYEGWAGPYYEMFPGFSLEDTMAALHNASRRGNNASRPDTVKPPGWDAYWGGSLPFNPISDHDIYYTYTDTAVRVQGHVPLRLKVVQSSYAWNDPYADAIIIFEYRIINMGVKAIDSAYIGFFFEADVGPINASQYFRRNFSEYIREKKTAYIHNPIDPGSTPVGIAILWPKEIRDPGPPDPTRPDTLRYTFQWFPGPSTPPDDGAKYAMLSSGVQRESEFPGLSDTRFVSAFGPFFIDPRTDTLKIAVAVVSGFSRQVDHRIILQKNAARALDIYLNQGIKLPATPPSPPLRVTVGDRRVLLDWQWRPGDDVLFGRPDPETNWDTTNQVARRDPKRYQSYVDPITGKIFTVPPGIDSTEGGRNFEAYRLWRSENPHAPDQSYTLLQQFDVIEDVDSARFEYETGLQYTFADTNLVRGKTYVYSVTSLSIPNLAKLITYNPSTLRYDTSEVPVDPLESGKNVNSVKIDLPFAVSKQAGRVLVVPNPYRTDRNYRLESAGYEGLGIDWNENLRVIKFINLPEKCTIRIFSLAGELVRTIHHDGSSSVGGYPRGDVNVPLLSESNRALASGIYIFTVESDLGKQTGKFVIIR